MHKGLVGLAACAATLMLSGTGSNAFMPSRAQAPQGTAVLPVAMCGFRCEFGGRYVPGPPSVCYERGMQFCGPSRPYSEERPRFYGGDRDYGGGCRTVTIERDDGTVRRIRRCD